MNSEEWEMVKLGDVCTKGGSNIAQKDLGNRNGEYPIYGAGGLIKTVDFYKQSKAYIAIVKDGAGIGRTMILPEKSSVIGTMQYIFPNDNIDIRYLYYAIIKMNLSKYFSGATIPHIYFKDYRNENVWLPPIKVQKQIADEIDKITGLIEKRKEQLEKVDVLVKSRFIEMFGDMGNNQNWKYDFLDNHLQVVGGYAFKSNEFTESGIPVLKIGNINSGYFKKTNLVYWLSDDKLKRYEIYPGDLVMSLTGTVGKDDYGNVCIIGDDFPIYYLNQRNAKLSLKNSLNKYYITEALKISEVKLKLTGISRGVRQANISNKDIQSLQLPIPPLLLQNQFADFVKQVDKSKFEMNKSLEKLETLKKALIQEYFE